MKNLQRSLQELRKQGYLVGVTETWNSFALRDKNKSTFIKGKHIDLFGFLDAVAIKDDITLGVQSCSNYADINAHKKKYREDEQLVKNIKLWLQAGNKFELWAFQRKVIKGTNRKWWVKIVKINTTKDLN